MGEAPLIEVLTAARARGFLGPRPVSEQLAHARGFLEVIAEDPDAVTVVDLGSGGGVPGLVISALAPESRLRVSLVDRRETSCAFLRWAVASLGLEKRTTVVHAEAETLDRTIFASPPEVVTARGFGAPGLVAECAAFLLAPGGRLIVSEPPNGAVEKRWPTDEVVESGYEPAAVRSLAVGRFAVVRRSAPPQEQRRRWRQMSRKPWF